MRDKLPPLAGHNSQGKQIVKTHPQDLPPVDLHGPFLGKLSLWCRDEGGGSAIPIGCDGRGSNDPTCEGFMTEAASLRQATAELHIQD